MLLCLIHQKLDRPFVESAQNFPLTGQNLLAKHKLNAIGHLDRFSLLLFCPSSVEQFLFMSCSFTVLFFVIHCAQSCTILSLSNVIFSFVPLSDVDGQAFLSVQNLPLTRHLNTVGTHSCEVR